MITHARTNLTINRQPLIDDYLAEQGRFTAVDRFSQHHDRVLGPVQQRYYRDLIPLDRPREGQQYAFEVDLDACSGCKACVAACHNLNGLDDDETWRDVGRLVGGPLDDYIDQHVTAACHHCLEPACLEGCPVLAYEKDPVTGIVRHLDDQCIGCQYCILKCPYDVPRYNKSRGIVRKCDMCSDRLAENEAPACVQACPTQAISIRLVDVAEIRARAEARHFLPGAPEPDYTLPTTTYRTKRTLPSGLRPADDHHVAPQHAHLPLVVMLVLTQLSVGGFVVAWAMDLLQTSGFSARVRDIHALVTLGLGLLALGASTLHLGRPLYAFRAVIGLRTSWLSREILGFGLFAMLAVAYAACLRLAPELFDGLLRRALGTGVAAVGLAAVFCSAMIYHDTRRPFWRLPLTAAKFYLTAAVLGIPSALLAGLIATASSPLLTMPDFMAGGGRILCLALAAAASAKMAMEAAIFLHLRDASFTPMKRTATLMLGELHQPTLIRFAAGIFGGVLIPLLIGLVGESSFTTQGLFTATAAVIALTLVGELLERYLFFTAVVAPKMPGGLGE